MLEKNCEGLVFKLRSTANEVRQRLKQSPSNEVYTGPQSTDLAGLPTQSAFSIFQLPCLYSVTPIEVPLSDENRKPLARWIL